MAVDWYLNTSPYWMQDYESVDHPPNTVQQLNDETVDIPFLTNRGWIQGPVEPPEEP